VRAERLSQEEISRKAGRRESGGRNRVRIEICALKREPFGLSPFNFESTQPDLARPPGHSCGRLLPIEHQLTNVSADNCMIGATASTASVVAT
jgi:hypothetical protein